MSATLLDGKALAASVRADVKARVDRLVGVGRARPGLAVILAGDDPASAVYVRNKARAAEEVGIAARTVRLPADVTASALAAEIDALNADPTVHGILVQLPLPASIDAETARRLTLRVHPDKDVDGFHPMNLGRLVAGEEGFVACTPSGCMRLIALAGVSLRGKHAVVVGRSTIVGKPMALLLLAADATVTVAHSRTQDLAQVLSTADVVVAAVGRAGLVRGEWLKPGACVVDVGINRLPDGRLVGDCDAESCLAVAGSLSPVPGGVGPMTIACLMENVCLAGERSARA